MTSLLILWISNFSWNPTLMVPYTCKMSLRNYIFSTDFTLALCHNSIYTKYIPTQLVNVVFCIMTHGSISTSSSSSSSGMFPNTPDILKPKTFNTDILGLYNASSYKQNDLTKVSGRYCGYITVQSPSQKNYNRGATTTHTNLLNFNSGFADSWWTEDSKNQE